MADKPSIFFTIFTLVMVPILASLLSTVNENRKTITELKKRVVDLEAGHSGSGGDVHRKLDDLSSQIYNLKKDVTSRDLSAKVGDIIRQFEKQKKLLDKTVIDVRDLKGNSRS